jgi:hypothetical protein
MTGAVYRKAGTMGRTPPRQGNLVRNAPLVRRARHPGWGDRVWGFRAHSGVPGRGRSTNGARPLELQHQLGPHRPQQRVRTRDDGRGLDYPPQISSAGWYLPMLTMITGFVSRPPEPLISSRMLSARRIELIAPVTGSGIL